MPIRRSQKKRNAELQQKQNHRRLVIDPMVNTGNSAHRHQARSKADPTRPHHRMVTLAQSSPGDRSACAPQSKTATVMLRDCRSPYRVVDDGVLCPIGSDEAAKTLTRAFVDLKSSGLAGGREHLNS